MSDESVDFCFEDSAFEDRIALNLVASMQKNIENWWYEKGEEGTFKNWLCANINVPVGWVPGNDENFAGSNQIAVNAYYCCLATIDALDENKTSKIHATAWLHIVDAGYWLGRLHKREDKVNPPSSAASEMAKLRHKDNNADRDFIQQWYREHRTLYPSKDEAATAAHEQRLVDQKWRTIRNYLNNI